MAMDPEFLESEEKRSYGATFLLVVALLLACTVWAIWQDSFSRHLWKKYKTDFYRLAIDKWEGELAAEEERLAGLEEYTQLNTELDDVRATLGGAGEAGARLKELERQLAAAEIAVVEKDLDLRIVKGEIEEGWYLLEHAQHGGESGKEEHARLDDLFAEKDAAEAVYEEVAAARDAILAQIAEVRAREKELENALRPYRSEIESLELKLDSVSLSVFGRRGPQIPVIEQVVLPDFERNNFENWVSRVDRCMNCHVAIDREGFEDQENPLKTHPDRKYYLGTHEPRSFGCTPCHGGQGPSINSVELAHGFVKFWEDPLLSTPEEVQAKCITCHNAAQGMHGAEAVARGEWLFEQMGCHGCHLVSGFADLPNAGPSLKRVAAKATPEWLVDWIEEPARFRPRTRMPHFFLDRDEATQISAYLLSASLPDAEAWLDDHATPGGIDAAATAQVKRGEELADSLGCLGCHGFGAGEFASEVAVGMDTAPNLSRIAEKTNARWLYHWILNPRGYSETARMPRLRLSESEAAAITSYLLTLREAPTPAVDSDLRKALADTANIDAGARLIRKYGCFGCHTINGMEGLSRVSVELSTFGSKHLEELFFGDRLEVPHTWEDWTVNKLLDPRGYATERIEQAMPEFGFVEEDAMALVNFLRGQLKAKINDKYLPDAEGVAADLKYGRSVVAYYNCHGCHTFEGKEGAIRRHYTGINEENAPPILVNQGIKLQPDWFVDFLKKPMRLRPWLDVRMPTFDLSDEEADIIVKYFAALDGYDIPSVVLESRDEAHASLPSYEVAPDAPVDCAACHPAGPGRVDEREYSVSRKTLTPAETRAWLAEHLGVEHAATGEGEDRAEALAEYLGAGG